MLSPFWNCTSLRATIALRRSAKDASNIGLSWQNGGRVGVIRTPLAWAIERATQVARCCNTVDQGHEQRADVIVGAVKVTQ
jgi:hypothetical protein